MHPVSISNEKSVTAFCKEFFILLDVVNSLRGRFEDRLFKMLAFNTMGSHDSVGLIIDTLAQDQDIVHDVKSRILEDLMGSYKHYLKRLKIRYAQFEHIRIRCPLELDAHKSWLLSDLPFSEVMVQLKFCETHNIRFLVEKGTLFDVFQPSESVGAIWIPGNSYNRLNYT